MVCGNVEIKESENMFEIKKISGIDKFTKKERKQDGTDKVRDVLYLASNGKAFLVDNTKTIEVRSDVTLGKILQEKYESVMQSRYFGKGGIEIVMSGQLEGEELEDLVRLSYHMTEQMTDEK